MDYYWIIAQHSRKALGVENDSVDCRAKIVQYTKKSRDDPNVIFHILIKHDSFVLQLILLSFIPKHLFRLILNFGLSMADLSLTKNLAS